MSDIKQVIVVRRDLNMRKGKIAAQVAHAAMKVWFDRMYECFDQSGPGYKIDQKSGMTSEMVKWKEEAFTKVVVGVETEDEIYSLAEEAKEKNIPYAIMVDNGFTEFHGNKTTTCIAIGPGRSEDLDSITGELKLL